MKKILIFDRIQSSKFPGGDTIQINAIKDYLRNNEYKVDVSDDPLIELTNYDIIFIFNLTNPFEAYVFTESANKFKKPYVFFPVYWNLDTLRYSKNIEIKTIAKQTLPKGVKWSYRAIKFIKGHFNYIKKLNIDPIQLLNEKSVHEKILINAKYICPNSYAELDHLELNFALSKINNNVKVIYNGINLDELLFYKSKEIGNSVLEKYKLPPRYVCCVGGMGPRKNQLNLIKAANEINVPLVIIGKASKGCEQYEKKIKGIAKSNIIFLGQLPQNEVFEILFHSLGHIQPSYIETPGLASLEAAGVGCNIVVSNTPPVREYFGDYALYCEPCDIESIKDALIRLIDMNQDGKLHNFVARYDWKIVLSDLNEIINSIRR